jgi:hypothetical protein
MPYRASQLVERKLVLRAAKPLPVTRLVLANLLVVGAALAATVLVAGGIGSGEALLLGACAAGILVLGATIAAKLRTRMRFRMVGRQLTIERLYGGRVVATHAITVDDATAVEVTRRKSGNDIAGYGLVLRAGEQRIALDDVRDDAMNDPLARQAELQRFLAGG